MPSSSPFKEAPVQFDPSWYPDTFYSSRERFLEASRSLGAVIDSVPVSTHTPSLAGKLFIDIALLGDPEAKKKLVIVAGTHGVEGFVGSAVQYALLQQLREAPQSYSMALVHCLNPWGMATLRRCNEQNVDLNRNCLFDPSERQGAPDGYELIRPLILPNEVNSFGSFSCKALLKVVQHGFSKLKQAITGGQFIDPDGLFYGGASLQPEIEIFQAWIQKRLKDTDRIFKIDIHSGLGSFCQDTILLDALENSPLHTRMISLFGRDIVHTNNSSETLTYTTRGALSRLIPKNHPDALTDQLVHEFGTLHPFKVLHALVNENTRFFQDSSDRTCTHVAQLKEAFCPASITWRMTAVRRGVALIQRAASSLA